MNKLPSLKALALALLLSTAAAAQADITVYTDRSAYLAAVGLAAVDNFNDLEVRSYGNSFARTAGPYGYTVRDLSGDPNAAPGALGIGFFPAGSVGDTWLATNTAADTMQFMNFSGGVYGFGGYFFGSDKFGDFVPGQSVVLVANDGVSSRTYELANSGTDSFLGFVSSNPLATVSLSRTALGEYWATANDVTLANICAPIPEPATYGMLLAGMFTLACVGRRAR